MLNPESPGAISVLARTCIYLCTLSELYLRVCANVCVCVCFFIRTWPNLYKYVIRETTTYAHLYVRVIYYEDEAGTRTFRLLVLCYMRAIGHVLNRATLRQLADRQLRIRTEIVAYFQRIIHMTNCLRQRKIFRLALLLIFNSFGTGDVLCASCNVYLIYQWRNICVKQGESFCRCQTLLKM